MKQTERSKKWLRLNSLAAIWLALLIGIAGLNAQDTGPTVNPYQNDPAAIQKGRELFSASCGFCHGKDGSGGSRGSDLTSGQWKHGGTDAAIFRNIADGIAGTAMPAHKFSESDIWQIVAFLRSLSKDRKWEHRYPTSPWTAGTLSTAGGLVFAGDNEGYLAAFDAATGKLRWRFQTGANIYASPMTYALDGKQYVVMPSGSALFTFALPDEFTQRATKPKAVSRRQK